MGFIPKWAQDILNRNKLDFAFEVEEVEGGQLIKDVPIFKLCTRTDPAGIEHDMGEAWAGEVIEEFEADAEQGHKPTMFVGHTTPGGPELPAVGRIESLALKAKELVSDLLVTSSETFDQIKEGNWPSRSVEVIPHIEDAAGNVVRKGKLQGVALLGGTPPFHKMAPLEVAFAEGEDAGIIVCQEDLPTLVEKVEQQDKQREISEALMAARQVFWDFEDLCADARTASMSALRTRFKDYIWTCVN